MSMTSVDSPDYVMVPINREILDRLKEYLASQNDTETTCSAVIANWIDKQIIADRQYETSPLTGQVIHRIQDEVEP